MGVREPASDLFWLPAPAGSRLAAAVTYEAEGDWAAAEHEYRAALSAGGPEGDAARWRLADLLGAQARYEELLTLLADLDEAAPPAARRWRGEAGEVSGDFEGAVLDYAAAARRSDPIEAEELTARIRYLLNGFRPEQLAWLADTCPFCPEGGYARLLLARQALAADEGDRAEALLETLVADFAKDPLGEAAEHLRDELVARRAIDPGRYGLLLPLSGPLQLFGQRALRGALLGARLLTPEPDVGTGAGGEGGESPPAAEGGGVRFSVYDTEGDPERAARGVERLARQGVVGIVGPLKGAVALRAAEVARRLGVPLITPTPVADVSGDGVFRLYLREQDEVSRLVQYAVRMRGLRRFALLYPDTPAGRRYRDLFWDAAVGEGAEITGVEAFPQGAGAPQVGDAIERLTGVYGLSKEEIRERFEARERIRLRRERELLDALGIFDETPDEPLAGGEMADPAAEPLGSSVLGSDPPQGEPSDSVPMDIDPERLSQYHPDPIVDFDAVFLPTSSLDAAQLAPQFPFRDVEGIVLLGIRSWNYPTLVEVGDEYVEGALFPAELHPDQPVAREFFAAYRDTYGEEPGVIDAYAYDAVHLLLSLDARQPLDTTRPALARRLRAVWAEAGVTGPLTSHPSGDIAASPKILTVRRGRVVPAE